MRLFLIGNHTCGNRGDGAILRGLVVALEQQFPGVELDISSRYPVSSSWLLGRECRQDVFRQWHEHRPPGRVRALLAKVCSRLLPFIMALAMSMPWLRRCLPKAFRAEIERMQGYDAVVQVGGSFFVDSYGTAQFESAFASLLAGRPLFLIGHSMGPFGGKAYRWLCRKLLERARVTVLREPVSLSLLRQAGLPESNVAMGSDTAWLVPAQAAQLPPGAWWEGRDASRPLVALTVRELAPFDVRLGVSQEDYEHAFARMAKALIERGCDVAIVSTCTGIDSYHRDDRMNGLRIAAKVDCPLHMHVEMGELDDVALGRLLAACDLLVGTRLHSVIIAMNFGTPAIAVNYEHKSRGVLLQLGLPELACDVSAVLDGRTQMLALSLLDDLPAWRKRVQGAVLSERMRALATVAHVKVTSA